MSKIVPTLILLSLIAFAGCSTPDVPASAPPDFVLEKALPLKKTPVILTEDLVKRLLTAENEYALLRRRHNILINWVAPPQS